MCVICYKPAGTEMPSDETIKQMFDTNPHGAGFAIQGKGIGKNGRFGVEYWKGFMKYEDLIKALKSKGNLKNKTVVIHCRIKTSGETDAYTTHPFKMSSNYTELRKLHGYGDILFHNGVFTGLGGKIDKNASDTQDFVVGVAMKHLRQRKDPSQVSLAVAQQIIGSCRVLILHANENYPMKKFGSWTKHTDGCEYSNMNWEHKYSTSTYSGSYHGGYFGSTRSQSVDIDPYGCNRAEKAWPSAAYTWLNCNTIARFNDLMKFAKLVEDKEAEKGYKIVKFSSTGEKLWYAYPETLDVVAEESFEDFSDYMDDMESLYTFGLDPDDEVIAFATESEAVEFFSQGKQISDFEFIVGGKTWLYDEFELTAYTEEGLKDYFQTNEQGHVRNNIRKYGTADKYVVDRIKHNQPTYDLEEDYYGRG